MLRLEEKIDLSVQEQYYCHCLHNCIYFGVDLKHCARQRLLLSVRSLIKEEIGCKVSMT